MLAGALPENLLTRRQPTGAMAADFSTERLDQDIQTRGGA
jgi:hypothetical protein